MRLIDLDQIEYFTLVDKLGVPRYKIEIGEDIGIEEVKAIPIEWIKRYIAEEGIYPNRELLSVEQADAIERMIENWEKENKD